MNQLQHVTEDFQLLDIWETLLFNKTTLSKLYKRVGQLQIETLQQKAKHKYANLLILFPTFYIQFLIRVNISHLQRMNTDCKFMTKTIDSLKDEIKETMIQKFGVVIKLDEIEEAYLRKLVYELRMSQTDIKCLYEEEMRFWKVTATKTNFTLHY